MDKKKRKGESGLRYAARMARDTRKKPAPSREQLEAAGLGANVTPLPDDREWKCPGCGWKFTTAHCPDCGIDREYAEARLAETAGASAATPPPIAVRERTCNRLYGRVRYVLDLAEKGEDAKAAAELREVLSFLGGTPEAAVPAMDSFWETGQPDVLSEPEYRQADDARAAAVLDRLSECAEGGANAVILDTAEASDVVQMLRSQDALARIAALTKPDSSGGEGGA